MRSTLLALGMTLLAATSALAEVPKDVLETFRRPLTIPFPDDAPYDPRIAVLGKMLYFDPRLSGAQNLSCATCHNPSFGWEAPAARAIGAANTPLGRHTPTVLDAAWVKPFFWDGRAASLEEQAKGPITAPAEMNATMDQVIARLGQVPEYTDAFEKLFPKEGMTEGTILRAIATFERTVVAGWSPFDRYVEGDKNAISSEAKTGFELFVGKAGCADCHEGWNFTDNKFHDIGLPGTDMGRGAIERTVPTDDHAFKTPGLRNIGLRAPYMHDGSLPNLTAVLDHYASGIVKRPSLSPQLEKIELTEADKKNIIAFLNTLTEVTSDVSTPVLPAN